MLRKLISKTLFQTLVFLRSWYVRSSWNFSKSVEKITPYPYPPNYSKKRKSTSRGRLLKGDGTLKKYTQHPYGARSTQNAHFHSVHVNER